MFKGKVILITGGTGSLGNELVSQLLPMHPHKIIIYSRRDHDQRVMMDKFNSPLLRFITGDIRNIDRLQLAMKGVDLVLHTAALKHVDLSEYNSFEYKEVIVDGGQNVIQACIDNDVERCVALSTDKSYAPVSVYGASKMLSDRLFMAANKFSVTKFSVIRYGNVINSNGSITKNLSSNPMINITDPRMTRFWITLKYAARLTIHLLKYSNKGELLIPKIPASNVLDFLKCVNPDYTDINVVGIRLGEKLNESMFGREDCINMLEFENYYVMYSKLPDVHERAFAGEVGQQFVPFEYSSDNMDWRLDSTGINKLLEGKFKWQNL